MTTARELITLALKEAGVLGVGQTALAEDMNDSFKLLTNMLYQWQQRRWLVPGLTHISMPGNSEKSNKIGPGQYYNCIRPSEIQAAWFTQTNINGTSQVSFPLTRVWAYEDYAKLALKELNTWPQAFFYDNHYPYGNVYIWPIPSSIYEINLVLKLPIGFNTSIDDGEIEDAGTLYTDGTYNAVALTGGSDGAEGATADITIAGAVVTTVTIVDGGNGYSINDVLSAAAADIGGTGSGFEFKITNVTSSIDNTLTMPPEYEEGIYYNLAIRLMSMYNRPTKPITVSLAKVGLNTIKRANTQIPTLQMPPALRGPKGFNIYNPDGGNIN